MMLLRSHAELARLAVVNFLLHFAHHIFSAVWVLYAGHRYGWTAWEVGLLLAMVGVLDMIIQGVVVGPAVKRFGDRKTMVFGLCGGAFGVALMGFAPTGLIQYLAMLPNALWGLAMPTLQSLMTRRVSESEQGQLQGANMSVASIAGIASPVFFGLIYSMSVGPGLAIEWSGLAFYISATILAVAAMLGWRVARAGKSKVQAAPAE